MSFSDNGFTVQIIGAEDIGNNYAALRNGDVYQIRLSNDRDARCDAKVKIDGINVGTWRIDAHGSITIKRPAKEDREFTFFKETSYQSRKANVKIGREENGLIEVTFEPEITYPVVTSLESARSMATAIQPTSRYSSGSTLMGNRSGQKFYNAGPLNEIDWNNVTTIIIRLVVKEEVVLPPRRRSPRRPPRIERREPYVNYASTEDYD